MTDKKYITSLSIDGDDTPSHNYFTSQSAMEEYVMAMAEELDRVEIDRYASGEIMLLTGFSLCNRKWVGIRPSQLYTFNTATHVEVDMETINEEE